MSDPVDLLIKNAWVVATMDDQRRELTGGWVAISDGYVAVSALEPNQLQQRTALLMFLDA